MLVNTFRVILDRHIPGPAPSYVENCWKRLTRAGLISGRASAESTFDVPLRDMATAVLARILSDELIDVAPLVEHFASERCVSSFPVRPGEFSPGRLTGIPPEWTATASLPLGHLVIEMLEALLRDVIAGRVEIGSGLATWFEIRVYFPANMIEFAPTAAAVEEIQNGSSIGKSLASMPIFGRYGPPILRHASAISAIEYAAATSQPRRSAVAVTRSILLFDLLLLGEAIANEN